MDFKDEIPMYGFLFVNGVNLARLINVGRRKLTKAASQTLWEWAGRIILNSHPQSHSRQAVGQHDVAFGSLICIMGLPQAIALRFQQALLFFKRGCNQDDELALS